MFSLQYLLSVRSPRSSSRINPCSGSQPYICGKKETCFLNFPAMVKKRSQSGSLLSHTIKIQDRNSWLTRMKYLCEAAFPASSTVHSSNEKSSRRVLINSICAGVRKQSFFVVKRNNSPWCYKRTYYLPVFLY